MQRTKSFQVVVVQRTTRNIQSLLRTHTAIALLIKLLFGGGLSRCRGRRGFLKVSISAITVHVTLSLFLSLSLWWLLSCRCCCHYYFQRPISFAFIVCDSVSFAVTLECRKLFAICLYFLWKRLVIGQFKNSRYLLCKSEIKRNSQTINSRFSPVPATGNCLTFDWFGPLVKTTLTRYCWDSSNLQN